MARYNSSLLDLCSCFRGTLPKRAEWMSLLGLANQTLTTPALMDFTVRFREHIPDEAAHYVREMFQRNLLRNTRLAEQLEEAVLALNEGGITPVLLKGAAMFATSPRTNWGSKLMSDLDIMVSSEEVDAALNSLFLIGYEVHFRAKFDDKKWYADLKRPRDVGMIDLHGSAPGPAFFYGAADDIYAHCELVFVGEGRAYLPSATYQAFMLIIHDQFQDHDYWIGGIDLRHLLDLRSLTMSSGGIDWATLTSLASGKLARNAIETQLLLMASLLKTEIPASAGARIIPRLQCRRRLLQARFSWLRYPLLSLGILDYRNYRTGPGSAREQHTANRRFRFFPARDTMHHLIDLCRQRRVGKL